MRSPQGVRKINENVLQEKRALILTDENKDNYSFPDLPDGTTYIDTVTGNEYIKLKGQADWVPKNVKQDNTINIVKDSMVIQETYTIKSIDKENHQFVYINDANEQRTGKIDDAGHFLFRLDKGTYTPGRNHLQVSIDGVLLRTTESGTLFEVDDQTFYPVDTDLEVGHVILVSYIQWIRIGNPYPRIFMSNDEPEDAEVGDLWIKPDGSITGGEGDDDFTPGDTIPWSRISNTPTTRQGYGITDAAALRHTHTVSEITDFPEAMKAKGGDSDTVGGHAPGTAPGNVLVLDASGKIPAVSIPGAGVVDWTNVQNTPTTLHGYGITDAAPLNHTHHVADIVDFPAKLPANGGNADTVGGHAPGTAPGNVLVLDADGKIPASVAPSQFVKGMIIDWFGQSNMIPEGWHLCDGTQGTPDLRDKFVVAAGGQYDLGATGGEAAHTLTVAELPAHQHSGQTAEAGAHHHGCLGENTSMGNPPYGFYDYNNNHIGIKFGDYDNAISNTSTDGMHSHSFLTNIVGENQEHNNLPPYVALFKIMKL